MGAVAATGLFSGCSENIMNNFKDVEEVYGPPSAYEEKAPEEDETTIDPTVQQNYTELECVYGPPSYFDVDEDEAE